MSEFLQSMLCSPHLSLKRYLVCFHCLALVSDCYCDLATGIVSEVKEESEECLTVPFDILNKWNTVRTEVTGPPRENHSILCASVLMPSDSVLACSQVSLENLSRELYNQSHICP